ncbi:MAG: hypothetical protein ABIK28_11120 [Planctomycetota bacterium]
MHRSLPVGSAGLVISFAYTSNNPFDLASNPVSVEIVAVEANVYTDWVFTSYSSPWLNNEDYSVELRAWLDEVHTMPVSKIELITPSSATYSVDDYEMEIGLTAAEFAAHFTFPGNYTLKVWDDLMNMTQTTVKFTQPEQFLGFPTVITPIPGSTVPEGDINMEWDSVPNMQWYDAGLGASYWVEGITTNSCTFNNVLEGIYSLDIVAAHKVETDFETVTWESSYWDAEFIFVTP